MRDVCERHRERSLAMYDNISDEEADRRTPFLCQQISLTSNTRSESRQEYSPVYVPHFFIDHMNN